MTLAIVQLKKTKTKQKQKLLQLSAFQTFAVL